MVKGLVVPASAVETARRELEKKHRALLQKVFDSIECCCGSLTGDPERHFVEIMDPPARPDIHDENCGMVTLARELGIKVRRA